MIQPPLVKTTEYLKVKGGRDHRRMAKANRSNKLKRGRCRHGECYQYVRACIMGISAKGGDKKPWVMLDVNRVFNARGICRSHGMYIWALVKRDPIFTAHCKVRLVQKIFPTNGSFPTIIARHANLAFDKEPLFYGPDGETYRHVRETLRGEDIEIPERHCPVSMEYHTKDFSTKGTAVINNGASAEFQSTSSAATLKWGIAESVPHEGTKTLLGLNLNSWNEFQSITTVGRKKLNQMAAQTVKKCLGVHYDNCKVREYRNAIFFFCFEGLRRGYNRDLIAVCYQRGVKEAHAQTVDGMARDPLALAIFLAKQFLKDSDQESITHRVQKFYLARSKPRQFPGKSATNQRPIVSTAPVVPGSLQSRQNQCFQEHPDSQNQKKNSGSQSNKRVLSSVESKQKTEEFASQKPGEAPFKINGALTKMFSEVLEKMKVTDNQKEVKIYKNPLTLNNRIVN